MAKPTFYKKPIPVRVIWHDADDLMTEAPWVPHATVREYAASPSTMETVGLLVGECRRYWILASTVQHGSDTRNGPNRIPKGCVDRIVRLRDGGKLRP